jgi:hypothetical protein
LAFSDNTVIALAGGSDDEGVGLDLRQFGLVGSSFFLLFRFRRIADLSLTASRRGDR